MAESPEPLFEPERFADAESGRIADAGEFIRQVDALIETGDIDPALEFIADAIPDADEAEQSLLSTVLFDAVNRAGTPEAALYHATTLVEMHEERGEPLRAAVCCHVAASVHVEKGNFAEAAPWVERLRNNLKAHADATDPGVELPRPNTRIIKDALEFESYYYLELSGSGRTKQAQAELAELMKEPVLPAETHVLASTLAFIEVDRRRPSRAREFVQQAERSAVEVGDYASAVIYACRRATYTADSMGYLFAKSAVTAADEYLRQARESGNDPEDIGFAADHLGRYKDVFFRGRR